MAVYDPALMLQGDWTVPGVAYIVIKALLAIWLWGGVVVGYLFAPLNKAQRVFAVVAAGMLVAAAPMSDEIGFAMSVVFIVWHLMQKRRLAVA